ncbi:hypothetical protein BDW74DRAFT_92165 [Aspergillus multicolor]|uniref:uncharacterized protein n=1 Tax=Aspergillus multicolor TaxID=41759 RepID=UPI003CCCFC46
MFESGKIEVLLVTWHSFRHKHLIAACQIRRGLGKFTSLYALALSSLQPIHSPIALRLQLQNPPTKVILMPQTCCLSFMVDIARPVSLDPRLRGWRVRCTSHEDGTDCFIRERGVVLCFLFRYILLLPLWLRIRLGLGVLVCIPISTPNILSRDCQFDHVFLAFGPLKESFRGLYTRSYVEI